MDLIQQGWTAFTPIQDKARRLVAKFKILRKMLREWKSKVSNLAATISNTKAIILMLDTLEEFRDLSLQEWNFRVITQKHLEKLQHWQKNYWKQRGQIKWVKFGDESTRFFHANATIKLRRNLITFLKNANGDIVSNHEEKAENIWNSFKQSLGTSEFTCMPFNLAELLQPVEGLHELEVFTYEKINAIIAGLPNNKSPGPDGFNGDFLKKYWPIIKQDFYDLCQAFYNGTICLKSINNSYVTLVPKIDSPQDVVDFRPISLLKS